MLSISTTPPAAWSPAPGPAVVPVTAAVPVAPVQATARDAQTGAGTPWGGSSADPRAAAGARPREVRTEERPAGAEAAPLLPRPSKDDGRGNPQSKATDTDETEAEREQQVREAQEQARKQRLQDVIANVWKASAAVVDRALGIEPGEAEAAGGVTGASGAREDVPLRRPVVPPTPEREAANDPLRDLESIKASQDVVAYDAQGHSSLAPLESGTLLNRRI